MGGVKSLRTPLIGKVLTGFSVHKRSLAQLGRYPGINVMFWSRITGVLGEKQVVAGLSVGYASTNDEKALIDQKLNTIWSEIQAIRWIRIAAS